MYFYNRSDIISFSTPSLSATFVKQQNNHQIIWTNSTTNSTTNVIQECYSLDAVASVLLCLFNVLICMLSILTNVLFCLAVYNRPRLRNLSMVSLVSLSITGIVISLLALFVLSLPGRPLGLINTPNASNAIWSFAVVAPFTTITVIAFERYLVTNRREFYKKHYTPFNMGLTVLFIWMYSLIWVAVMASCLKHAKKVETYDWSMHHYLEFAFVGLNVGGPLVITSTLYYLIRRRVKWARKCVQSTRETTSLVNDNEMVEREIAFTNSTINVVIILFTLWIVILIYAAFNHKCLIKIIYLVNTVLPLNCFLNPILYSYGNREVRTYLKDLKNRLCNCYRDRNLYATIDD